MSLRKDIRTDLINTITALLADQGCHVDKWQGERISFNEGRLFPAVYVGYAGAAFGQHEEIGDGATYRRDFIYSVHVTTATTAQADGEDAAMDLLELIEKGLAGQLIAGYGQAELIADGATGLNEHKLAADSGKFLFVQLWRVPGLESH